MNKSFTYLDKNLILVGTEFRAALKAPFKEIKWPEWWRLVIVAATIGALVWFSITLTREAGNVAAIWLSNAVLLGILLRVQSQHWIAYLMVGFLANIAADRLFGDSTALAVSISASNMIEVTLAGVLLRASLSDASDLTQRRTLKYFLVYGVIVAPAISALLGATILRYFSGTSFSKVLETWFLADAVGIALLTPLVLSIRRGELTRLFGKEMVTKTIGMLMLTIIATVVVFVQSTYPLRFIMFPILMLTIFELGFTGTAIAIFLIAIIGITFTVGGSGPMMGFSGLTVAQRIFFVQINIATVVLVALPIAVVLAEREHLGAKLEKANIILHSLAMTDSLTGLANRRQFDEMLEREWRRTARESGVISLLLLDIDYFKLFNDYYGHQAGDECLKKVAQTLMSTMRRSGDVCARYGGEEFAVILPNIDTKQAILIAEAIRSAVEAIKITHVKGKDGRLTVSIGVASIKPRDPDVRIGDLVEAADRVLYDAKRCGRNRTMAA